MLYSTLALTGKFTLDELKEFRQWGSPTPGHPERDLMRGIENTSGPLGQGHTFAVGAAIAAKFMKARFEEVMNQTIYAYISDGGVQRRFHKVQAVLPALWAWTTSSCSMMQTTSSSQPKQKM